jgi:hypothetical protein
VIVENFQATSKRVGNNFEESVLQDLKSKNFRFIDKDVTLEEIGCEIDFIAFNELDLSDAEYVEAKGGEEEEGKRPGAKRTDSVKKAIANAALMKASMGNVRCVAYFSSKPNPNSSSDKMLTTALKFGILDEIRFIEGARSSDKSWTQDSLDLGV